MVLSAALDNGYIFLSFIAILTSVIGAVYYLSIIKEIFFFSTPEYKINPLFTRGVEGVINRGRCPLPFSNNSLPKIESI